MNHVECILPSYTVSELLALKDYVLIGLERSWGDDTCSPGNVAGRAGMPPSFGQCAVTALVIQDLAGGEIVRAVIEGEGSHYWNRLPGGQEIDLTRDQFPDGTVIPVGNPVERSYLLEHERSVAAGTPERYLLLRQRLAVYLSQRA